MFKRTLSKIALTLLAFAPLVIEGTFESIKAAGMGGATLANGQDALSPALNPALGTEIGSRWDVGISFREWFKSLTIDPPRPAEPVPLQLGTLSPSHLLTSFPAIGANFSFCDRFSLSISGYEYKRMDTRYNTQLTDFSGFSLEGLPSGSDARLLWGVDTITTAVACKLNHYHSIGIGINWNIGHFRASGFNRMPGTIYTIDPSQAIQTGHDTAFGVGMTIGWVGHLCNGLKAGVSYTPETHMSHFRKYSGLLAEGRINLPETARAGVAYELDDCLTIALDGEWRGYSRIHALANPFPGNTEAPFAEVTLFGRSDGPGFGWKDEWVIKTGFEYAITPCLKGRLGYRHEWNPLRNHTTNTAMDVFIVETVVDYLTTGFTYTYCGLETSFFGEYGFKQTLHSRYPSINEIQGDFLPADLTYKSHNYALGISLGSTF